MQTIDSKRFKQNIMMTRRYRYNISILYREKILTRLIAIRDYKTVNDTLT